MGSQTKDFSTSKQSKKCLVTGPLIRRNELPEFKKFLHSKASESGNVERVEVDILPDSYLLPEIKAEGRVAIIASVLFKVPNGPAKFISDFDGKVYAEYTAVSVMRINEKATIQEIVQSAGHPDFGNEDYVYLLIAGLFLPQNNSEVMAKKICDELEKEIDVLDIKPRNITEMKSLEVRDGKVSYAIIIEYNSSVECEKATRVYPALLESKGYANLHFSRQKEKLKGDQLYNEIPEEFRNYKIKKSNGTTESKEDMRLLKVKVNHKTFNMSQFTASMKKFGDLGCKRKCGKCAQCTAPVKVFGDSVEVTFCSSMSAQMAKKSQSNGTNCSITSVEDKKEDNSKSGNDKNTTFLPKDVIAFLPTKFIQHETDLIELQKIIDRFEKVGDTEKQDVFFPKSPMESNRDIIFLFRFKKLEDAEKALRDVKIEAWNQPLKITKGTSININEYEISDTGNDNSKSSKKIDKKIWQKTLNEAQSMEQDNKLADAQTTYKFVYVNSISEDHLQSVASEAATGIASIRMKNGDLVEAIDGLLADMSEINLQFISSKLLIQLASAFLLHQRVSSAALIGLYGLTPKPQQPFELLLLHIGKEYPAQMEVLKKFMEDREQKKILSKMNIREVAEFANDLKIKDCPAPNASKIAADKKRFKMTGVICLDEKEKIKIIESELNTILDKTLRHLRAEKFNEAAKSLRDAQAFISTPFETSIVAYAQSMALLNSKSLESVKEGHQILKEAYELNSTCLNIPNVLPAMIYGLAKFEVALHEAQPTFLSQSLKKSADFVSDKATCQKKLGQYFPELIDASEVVRMLEKLNEAKPEILATCRYKDCQKLHLANTNKCGILPWTSTICRQDLDYKGYYTLICTEKCRIDFHFWCWKCKKEEDGKNLDKDYLQDWCLTPDCGAPICKVIVVKDDPNDALELSDDDITKKMLLEKQKKKDKKLEVVKEKAFKETPSPKHNSVDKEMEKENVNVTNTEAENAVIEEMAKKMQEMKLQLEQAKEQAKASEKNLTKQLNKIKSEKEETDKKNEEIRGTSKRLLEENKSLRKEIVERASKSQSQIDRLKNELRDARYEHERTKLKSEQELCRVIDEESKRYLEFVGFVNEHLHVESEELPKLIGSLNDRQEKAKNISADQIIATKQALFSIPIQPDYNVLLLEIVSQTPSVVNVSISLSVYIFSSRK